jgi:hypothetical protein
MQVVQSNHNPMKIALKDATPGETFLNGEGNLVMLTKDSGIDDLGKRRLVNLEHGGTYTVPNTCRYLRVMATVTWGYPGEGECK